MLDWIIGGALIGALIGVIYAMMSGSSDDEVNPNEVAAPSIDQLRELASEVEEDEPAPATPQTPSMAQSAPQDPADPTGQPPA